MPTSQEKYTFLSWLKRGNSNYITQTEENPEQSPVQRASFTASIAMNQTPVHKTVSLLGPADVVGLNPNTILRVEPEAGVSNFESNYLASVEFYEEDLLWRYTPAAAHGTDQARLSPWVTLIVMKDSEFHMDTSNPGRPFAVLGSPQELNYAKILPSSHELWAWAHVQVNKSYDPGTPWEHVVGEINADRNLAISRLICPRKLEDSTRYTAIITPVFLAGKMAFFNEPTDSVRSLVKAWGETPEQINQFDRRLPVYYQWSFSTGELGDFLTLAKLLKANLSLPDSENGAFSIADPGAGMSTNLSEQNAKLFQPGVLKFPNQDPVPVYNNPAYSDFEDQIKEVLEFSLQSGDTSTTNPFLGDDVDPGLLPSIYGHWYARTHLLNGNPEWLNEMNIDPRYRLVAAVGQEIVQRHQEEFMEEAWSQVEDIVGANTEINHLRLSEKVAGRLFEKHIHYPAEDMDSDAEKARVLHLTSHVHERVASGADPLSVKKRFEVSRIPDPVVSAGFRKLSRPFKRYTQRLMAGDANLYDISKALIPHLNSEPLSSDEKYPLHSSLRSQADSVPLQAMGEASVEAEQSFYDFSAQGGSQNAFAAMNNPAENTSSFTHQLNSLQALAENIEAETLQPLDLSEALWSTIEASRPSSYIVRKLQSKVEIWNEAENEFQPVSQLQPLLAEAYNDVLDYPHIDVPVYELLQSISADYIIPNVSALPENSVTLMEVNNKFLASLFVGLNHELSREFIWREYPTDQQGTYFDTFWSRLEQPGTVETNDVTTPIHQWGNQPLGYGLNANGQQLVLVVKGDLLKKFPDTVIYARKAAYGGDGPAPGLISANTHRKIDHTSLPVFPAFRAKLEGDITLIGFDISEQTVKGINNNNEFVDYGYYFTFQERPGQIRFGLEKSDVIFNEWINASWPNFENELGLLNLYSDESPETNADQVVWGRSASDIGYVLVQNPVCFYVHAINLLL